MAVLRRIRKENEQALQVSREMERARCVARKNLVKEQQRKSQERKAVQREAQLQSLRMNREAAREEIDDVTACQLQQAPPARGAGAMPTAPSRVAPHAPRRAAAPSRRCAAGG